MSVPDSKLVEPRILRLLIIEDSEDDTELLVQILRRAQFDVQYLRVDCVEGLKNALVAQKWDLVISDHNLPQLDSISALEIIRSIDNDLPVIIVSGSIGEELAVQAMQAGAQDYVLKDKLSRMVPAIQRELKESEIRRAHHEAEEAVHFLAYHDPLTKLPNRHKFSEYVEHALQDSRKSGREHALLYVDLDQFRLINDICGHAAGDDYLLNLSEHLKTLLGEDDAFARLGGDAFGFVFWDCPFSRAREVAEQVRNTIKNIKYIWRGRMFQITGSVGLVPICDESPATEELISAADMACYAAKDNGRDQLMVSTAKNTELRLHQEQMEWTTRIRDALSNDKFQLFSQKIVSLDPSRADCREYLLRLSDETEGVVLPAAFLSAAERYSMMVEIDKWVIGNALRHMGEAKDPRSCMRFVNISGSSIMDDDFCQFVYDKIGSVGYAPLNLCFEITENAAIRRIDKVLDFIAEIKALGCKFALDDFGSGMCSLSYLKTLPVDYLKIDGSFITKILDSPIDFSIVSALQRISQMANMITVAECVEREDVLTRIREIGIDYAQGFLLGMPEAVSS